MTRSSDKLRCFWILRNYGRNEQRIPYSSGGTLRDLVNSERTIKVDHVTIRSNKPFATVKANLERLVPKLDEEISELAAAGEVARAKGKT